jgi:tRNA nucleotidyltransferase (CCA-adding enzyme)
VLAKGRDASDDLAQIAALREHVARVVAAGAALSLQDLKINGRDLSSELGLRPGPKFGEILRVLLDEVVEDPSRNTRESLLARAAELAAAPAR